MPRLELLLEQAFSIIFGGRMIDTFSGTTHGYNFGGLRIQQPHSLDLLHYFLSNLKSLMSFNMDKLWVQRMILYSYVSMELLEFLWIKFGIPFWKQVDVDPIHCIDLSSHVDVHFESLLLSRQKAIQSNDPCPVLIAVQLQHRLF